MLKFNAIPYLACSENDMCQACNEHLLRCQSNPTCRQSHRHVVYPVAETWVSRQHEWMLWAEVGRRLTHQDIDLVHRYFQWPEQRITNFEQTLTQQKPFMVFFSFVSLLQQICQHICEQKPFAFRKVKANFNRCLMSTLDDVMKGFQEWEVRLTLLIWAYVWDVIVLILYGEKRRGRKLNASGTASRSKSAQSTGWFLGAFMSFLVRLSRVALLVYVANLAGKCSTPAVLLQHPSDSKTSRPSRNVWDQFPNLYVIKDSNRREHFGTHVDCFQGDLEKTLRFNRVIGDGNCLWRAIAAQTPTRMKWYTLKRQTIAYMKAQASEANQQELLLHVEKLAKRNAWGNLLAILGATSLLGVPIFVTAGGQVIRCLPGSNSAAKRKGVYLHYSNFHFSVLDPKSISSIPYFGGDERSYSLGQFTAIPIDNYPKHKAVMQYSRGICHSKRTSGRCCRLAKLRADCTFSACAPQICKTGLPQTRAESTNLSLTFVSPTMVGGGSGKPIYKPAGNPSPTSRRRLDESFAAQVERIAKAKTSSVPAAFRNHPTPTPSQTKAVEVPQTEGSTSVLKATPMKRRPPTPPQRPTRNPSAAPNLVLDSPKAVPAPAANAPATTPKHKAMPRAASVVVSSAIGGMTPSEPAHPPAPPNSEVRVLHILSEGARFRVAYPWETRSNYWVQRDVRWLRDVTEESTDYSHIGTYVDTISKFLRNPQFLQEVKDALKLAVESEHSNVALAFKCTSGRHRSVALAAVARDIMRIVYPEVQIHVTHTAAPHWAPQIKCAGQCSRCTMILTNPPPLYSQTVERLAREFIVELRERYMQGLLPGQSEVQPVTCTHAPESFPGGNTGSNYVIAQEYQLSRIPIASVDGTCCNQHLYTTCTPNVPARPYNSAKTNLEFGKNCLSTPDTESNLQQAASPLSWFLKFAVLALCTFIHVVRKDSALRLHHHGADARINVLHQALIGGMDSSTGVDPQLFEALSPIPNSEDDVDVDDLVAFYTSLQCSSEHNLLVPSIEYKPEHSLSWVGAQKDFSDAISEHSLVAATQIDDSSETWQAQSSDDRTRTWHCSTPPAKRRCLQAPFSHGVDGRLSLRPSNCDVTLLSRNTDSEASSIQNFLETKGHMDESNQSNVPLLLPTLHLAFGQLQRRQSCVETLHEHAQIWPDLDYNNDHDSSSSHFWSHWSIDSDGHMFPGRQPICGTSPLSASVTPTSQKAPSEVLRELDNRFASVEPSYSWHADSSHPSLDSLLHALMDQPSLEISMPGGAEASDGFLPNKVDVSRMVQKLKSVPHKLQPKQVRMLLLADNRLLAKIQKTSDVKQLLQCITAAGVRMGILAKGAQDEANKFQHTAQSEQGGDTDKNDSNTSASHHKGKGTSQGKTHHANVADPLGSFSGKSKGKGKSSEASTGKGKGKGKGSHAQAPARSAVSFALDPSGWNVHPFETFQQGHGAVYFTEREDTIRQYAELATGKPFPIAVLAPKPYDVGFGEPEPMYVEVCRTQNGISQNMTVQAYLHQLTLHPVTYNKTAPRVDIKRPEFGKTTVLYATFLDEGASVQTKVEIKEKKTIAIKQWLMTIIAQHKNNKGLEILDVWNLQHICTEFDHQKYQVSFRVRQQDVEQMLSYSGPGRLQVNAPGFIKERMDHIWLKDEGKPIEQDKVLDILSRFEGKHLGAFFLRGTWALRASKENINSLRQALGRTEEPAYFLSNCSPEWDVRDVEEVLRQLKWFATVKEQDRKWRNGACTWLVRSQNPPAVWGCPINYGYERRMLKIFPAKRPARQQNSISSQPAVFAYNTWGAQFKSGSSRAAGSSVQSNSTFAAVLMNQHGPSKRPKIAAMNVNSWRDVPDEELDKDDDEDLESPVHREDERDRLLSEMRAENMAQKQQIQDLMAQVQTLIEQISVLTQQNAIQLPGGANNQPPPAIS